MKGGLVLFFKLWCGVWCDLITRECKISTVK
nr:MAG TPA: hypothetical protein [Caudoviricetes sp.]